MGNIKAVLMEIIFAFIALRHYLILEILQTEILYPHPEAGKRSKQGTAKLTKCFPFVASLSKSLLINPFLPLLRVKHRNASVSRLEC
jgi:hypothetical protein